MSFRIQNRSVALTDTEPGLRAVLGPQHHLNSKFRVHFGRRMAISFAYHYPISTHTLVRLRSKRAAAAGNQSQGDRMSTGSSRRHSVSPSLVANQPLLISCRRPKRPRGRQTISRRQRSVSLERRAPCLALTRRLKPRGARVAKQRDGVMSEVHRMPEDVFLKLEGETRMLLANPIA